jgi:two-component system chemotaxis response regulator CheY
MSKISTNPKVLVVDDMKSMRNLIKACLGELGLTEISEATDGKMALALLRSKPFDLVICDWDMPTMDGLEVLRTVRSEERLAELRFIMLTANALGSKVREAIDAGVSDYVAKPFLPETLQKKVARQLSR